MCVDEGVSFGGFGGGGGESESEAFRFYSDDGESTSERLSQRSEGDSKLKI